MWNPKWSQSSPGCPIKYTIYRKILGVRIEATSFETDVLYSFITSTDPIELKAKSSDIDTYDLQEWDLNIVAESETSTHENKEASIDFRLSLRNVCWDLPLEPATSIESEWSFTM